MVKSNQAKTVQHRPYQGHSWRPPGRGGGLAPSPFPSFTWPKAKIAKIFLPALHIRDVTVAFSFSLFSMFCIIFHIPANFGDFYSFYLVLFCHAFSVHGIHGFFLNCGEISKKKQWFLFLTMYFLFNMISNVVWNSNNICLSSLCLSITKKCVLYKICLWYFLNINSLPFAIFLS